MFKFFWDGVLYSDEGAFGYLVYGGVQVESFSGRGIKNKFEGGALAGIQQGDV